MKYLIGTILTFLALFGLGKYSPKKPTELDNKQEEIENDIENVDAQIEDVEENGVEELEDGQVVEYWGDKK